MIQKTTLSFFKVFILFGIILFTKSSTYAQNIIPDILTFDRICAGGVTNPTYKASFTYSGYAPGTTFLVQLSDKSGSFSAPTATSFIDDHDDAPNKKTITFGIPSDIVGSDTYALRIISSGGQPSSGSFSSSTTKKLFPIYFKTHDQQYTINNFIGTATFCAGGNYVLSIDPIEKNPDSPLIYPSLAYNWYRDNGTTTLPTLVQGNGGPTYTVTTPGTYYVETNYGTCTSLSYSNRVIVSTSGSGSAVVISSSLGNPFCPDGAGTVLTATSGNSYVWKKDGKLIEGAAGRSINANESGVYTVDVDFGGCVSGGSINLKSNSFTASIDVPETYKLKEGETLSVSVTTDAATPTFEWFLNDIAIQGASSGTYLVAVRGRYKVVISQSAGCISSKEFTFSITGESKATVIPNIVKLSGDIPFWDIPIEYKTDTTKLIILSSNGEIMFDDVGSKYDPIVNSFIKDFKNVNPVYYYVIQSDTGEKKGSITVIK